MVPIWQQKHAGTEHKAFSWKCSSQEKWLYHVL